MNISYDFDLSSYTTFRTPCIVERYIPLCSEDDLRELLANSTILSQPWLIVWWWSNILFTQASLATTVLHNRIEGIAYIEDALDEAFFGDCCDIESYDGYDAWSYARYDPLYDARYTTIPHRRIIVGGWTSRAYLIAWMLDNGLYWLENLTSIPGSVWACPVQNIWAYGCEVSQYITAVIWYDLIDRKKKLITHSSCAFWYRDSIFKNELKSRFFISHVIFSLPTYDPTTYRPACYYPDIKQRMSDHALTLDTLTPRMLSEIIAAIRAKKFPNLDQHWCAGSFFKNCLVSSEAFHALQERFPNIVWYPDTGHDLVKIPTWRILDHIIGVKWVRHGSVGCRDHQALVVVNYDFSASGSDVAAFGRWLQDAVFTTTWLYIQPEVMIV
jgi:UDP-N-acetylmuramate dehydrogenase